MVPDVHGLYGSAEQDQSLQGESDAFRIVRLPVGARVLEGLTGIFFTPTFGSVFRKLATDTNLVHFHGFRSYQNLAAAKATREHHMRYVIQPHGTSVRGYGKAAMKLAYDLAVGIRQSSDAAALIASAHGEATQLHSLGIAWDKIHTIPNGVRREVWAATPADPSLFRDSLRIPAGTPVILFAGRLDRTKGLDLLVNAFGLASAAIPESILVLAGPDFGVRSRLEAQVRRLGLEGRVVFTGFAGRALLHSAYKQSTVVVIPSTYESFGIVALEAAAANTPVLMTEACGLAPVFRSAGLAIVNPDPVSISNLMIRLVQDEGFHASQQDCISNLPWTSLSWPEVARKVLDLYRDVMRN
jgi:glycosyltransferase involved in cell wall biosynthesis